MVVWWLSLFIALSVGSFVAAFFSAVPFLAISLAVSIRFQSRWESVRTALYKPTANPKSQPIAAGTAIAVSPVAPATVLGGDEKSNLNPSSSTPDKRSVFFTPAVNLQRATEQRPPITTIDFDFKPVRESPPVGRYRNSHPVVC